MKKIKLFSLALVILLTAVSITLPAAAAGNPFYSQSDYSIKLRIDWSADYTAGGDSVAVTANVYLDHYAITVGARSGGSVTVGGDTLAFSTPAIKQESQDKSSALLASHSVKVPYKQGEKIDIDVSARWLFNGTYGGKQIGWLEAAGKVTFDGTNVSSVPVSPPAPPATTPPATTAPTNPPSVSEGVGGPKMSNQGTIKSDTGSWINMRAVWDSVESTTAGMVTYNIALYLDHYSLFMSPRNGTLKVAGKDVPFSISAISEPGTGKKSLLLVTTTVEAAAGTEITIEADFAFNGVYSGVNIGNIKLAGTAKAE